MGALSIGKVHKDSLENLVGLPIDKNAGRVGRARAARKMKLKRHRPCVVSA